MLRCLPPAAVIALLLACPARAEDWPTYQHDETRVGATSENLQLPLSLSWVYKPAASPRSAWEGPRSAPIEGHKMVHRVNFDDAHHVAIVGDRVIFGSAVDHHVYCVAGGSGEVIWSFATEGPVRLAPTVSAGRVYFGSDDGQVYCLRADNGEVVWSRRVALKDERLLARGQMISRWPVRTGVLLREGVAYFGAGVFPHETVYLCAADAETGKILWCNDQISQRDAGRDDLSPQGYLLANQDLLFVPSGRSLPAAFNMRTGEFVYKKSYAWRSSAGGVVGGSRAILADGQLYSFGAHHFLALSQESGSAGFAYFPGEQLVVKDKIAYIANGKEVLAVDHRQHAEASVKRQALFLQRGSLRSKPKELAKLDRQMDQYAQQGILWRTPFDGDSALTLTGNLVLAGGVGKVVALDVKTGQPQWSDEVSGSVRGLAVANGMLVVSTTDGFVRTYTASASGSPRILPSPPETNPFGETAKDYGEAAEQILREANVKQGFCLVLGSREGRLAYELARRSQLKIYGVEEDAQQVAASRAALRRAGLYGERVVILRADPANVPLSNYFANLVVSESMLSTGTPPAAAEKMGRFVKPCGGRLVLGGTPNEEAQAALQNDLATMYVGDEVEVLKKGRWIIATRGKLAGAGDWSHQYGNVGNTSMSQDQRVKGSLGVLWYGDPGPSQVINRHEAASAPLSTNGRFFSQGTDSVRAYDAYNGLFLWEYKNPGAIRTGVFNNYETSNLAATDDELFVVVEDHCRKLDAATGKVLAEYRAMQGQEDEALRHWGYVAVHDGLLYGTSNVRRELADNLRRRGRTIDGSTETVFAVDYKTDQVRWQYHGKNIMHQTIAIGDGRVFFVESSITPQQREALIRQDKTDLKDLPPDEAKKKEEELKRIDIRLAVALDARTGEKIWSKPVDITDCIGVSAGGGNLSLMYSQGHVVLAGANANGHYWSQFLAGEFSRRRLVVLDSSSGEKLWAKDADYMNRPVLIGEYIIAEPWAFEIHTGQERTRVHPVTGEVSKWRFSRPGHHCGIITGTPNMMLFRSGFIGYYDLYADSGTRHFSGQRLGCWVNAIPGNGLVVIPEASAGCVCLFSITSTVVLEPREDRDPAWGVYSAVGPQTPVKHLAVNLGAPGDRREQLGTLWLGYPRPNTVGRLEYTFDIKPRLIDGGGYYSRNSDSLPIGLTETDWLYTTGAHGLTRCELPLLDQGSSPTNYTVKLYFAELDASLAGKREFDIKLQGTTVARRFQVESEAGGVRQALIRTFSGVPVTRNLVLELVPPPGAAPPILSAIEVQQE